MAVLPGSTRTFAERVGATPFLDWLAPQLGLLEAAALLVIAGLAAWTARPAGPQGRIGRAAHVPADRSAAHHGTGRSAAGDSPTKGMPSSVTARRLSVSTAVFAAATSRT